MSTSKPRSAKLVAITLAPRSWPSWPILAMSMRGLRPSSAANRSVSWRTAQNPGGFHFSRIYARNRAYSSFIAANTVSRAVDISWRGTLAGSINRQRQQIAMACLALSVSAFNAWATSPLFRSARNWARPFTTLLLSNGGIIDFQNIRSRAYHRSGIY